MMRQHRPEKAAPERRALSRVQAFVAFALSLTCAAAASAQESPKSDDAGPRLEEIVVTATRRAESINKVSASIAAYNQEAMDQQGIRSFSDIVTQTPGLSLLPQSTFQPPNIAIRGIRSVVGAATTGIYIDDTPVQARNSNSQDPGDALPAIFDLERVEVLRGPQGTLFGSGSEGGAVRFISPTPNLGTASFYGRSEVATTDSGDLSYEAGLAAGTPIIDGKLGVRFSASYRESGGYIDRINERTGTLVDRNANNSEVQTMKVSLLFAPNDILRITPSVNCQETRAHDVPQFYTRLSDRSEQRLISGRTLQQPITDRFYLPAVKLEADFGAMTLTSVTSYFSRDQSAVQDFSALDDGLIRLFNTFSPVPDPALGMLPLPALLPADYSGAANVVANTQDNFTQELRLQSNDADAPLSWLVGAYVQRNRQGNNIHVDDAYYAAAFSALTGGAPNVNGVSNYTLDFLARDRQVAGYANLDYRFGKLKASVGARVAEAKYSFRQFLDGPLNGGPHTNLGEQKESPVTPKASLTWEPSDDALLYASASKGFRVGGANTPIASTPPCLGSLAALGLTESPATYESDSVWNYELGGKFSLLDRKLHINASAYHIDWTKIQSFVALSGCANGFIANLGAANSDGFDLALSARPFESLLISEAVGYNRSVFEETIVKGGIVLAEKGAIVSDAPPWQLTTTVEYSRALNDGSGYIRGISQYATRNDSRYSKFENAAAAGFDPLGQRNDGYHLLSLRVGWRNDNLDLALFADNLLNSHPLLNMVSNALPTDITYYAGTLRPRTVGLTFTARH